MDSFSLSRAALPFLTAAFVLGAIVLPTWRLRRAAGTTGFVAHQGESAVRRVLAFGMGAIFLAALVWSLLVATVLPEVLGIWVPPRMLTWAGWALALSGFLVIVLAQC